KTASVLACRCSSIEQLLGFPQWAALFKWLFGCRLAVSRRHLGINAVQISFRRFIIQLPPSSNYNYLVHIFYYSQ
ncbi:hypothetical protein, partial [Yersinia pestis]|uniref:hypothetical protein n=1 Tax=Yersinia pestis TaxID=632 RepID=UPI001EE69B75